MPEQPTPLVPLPAGTVVRTVPGFRLALQEGTGGAVVLLVTHADPEWGMTTHVAAAVSGEITTGVHVTGLDGQESVLPYGPIDGWVRVVPATAGTVTGQH